MSNFEHAIDVNVPVNTAYNQWTQFEDFPMFMEGIEEVKQLDDKRLFWKANIAGINQEWYAEITEQLPDERIAWTSTSGAKHAGVITFHYVDETTTRIMYQMDYNPEGFIENVGDALGIVKLRVKNDLENFKQFIEERHEPTGAWRGEIEKS
jgi:uncharacterized membrane protein